ncbi:MAG TPA: c-type cytochrome [Lentimicrobium sp.]|nr:c-type cytochrome [Lentimicrobium sp.]
MKHTIRKKGVIPGIMLLSVLLFLLIPESLQAQDGRQLFEKHCTVCHKIGEGKLVGPDLKDITQRRERDWLVRFIRNSKEMIDAGDPLAVQVFEENNKVPMQAFENLSGEEINSIIDYIEKWEPAKPVEFQVDVTKRDGFTEKEIMRGERMFYGLIPLENGGTTACNSCHVTQKTDTLNWNPSAHELAKSFMEEDGMDLYASLADPQSAAMQKAHGEYKLSGEEMYYIAAYFSNLREDTPKPFKTFPTRFLLFVVFAILMTLAIVDLIFTRIIKYRFIHGIILLTGIAIHFNLAVTEAQSLSRTKDYAPDQPIKFSHKIHAGDNQTDCRYCHTVADYSKSAGFPSNDVCLNCHIVVREGRNSGKFEINKIFRAEKSGKPIEWIRIHNMQEHVFFSHAQHVNAGKIECETCHGPVAEMDIMKQFSDLSMGWCINCHRDTKVNFKDNNYYSTYMKLHDDLKSGRIDSVTVEQIGGLDCMKCHY